MGRVAEDITGLRFGSLVAIKRLENNHEATWLCKCDCGADDVSLISKLKRGKSKCATCFAKIRGKHRLTGTHEYRCWSSMKQRVTNPNPNTSKYYLLKGVTICERWLKFENFVSDMGMAPTLLHSIDRYPDKNGNYEPSNCRWATQKQQNRNKNNNKIIEYNGEKKCLVEWCEIYGLEKRTLCGRLLNGWDIEKALTTPSTTRLIEVNGVKMPIAAAERMLGFKYGFIRSRLDTGLSLEEAISTPSKKLPILITIEGVVKRLPDWCKEYGIKYKTAKGRIDEGWSLEQAVTTPIRKRS